MFPNVVSCVDLSAYVFWLEFAVVMNLSLGDVMFVSIKNCICKNFVCRMCVRWWVYFSETRLIIIIIIIIMVIFKCYFSGELIALT